METEVVGTGVPLVLQIWMPLIVGVVLSPLAQYLKKLIPPKMPFRAVQIITTLATLGVNLANTEYKWGMSVEQITLYVGTTVATGMGTGIILQRISNMTGKKFLGNVPSKTDWRGRPK